MGRKKITKAAKNSKKAQEEQELSEQEVQVEKKNTKKGAQSKASDPSLFSDSFNNRIQQFKSFYGEYLANKGDGDQEEFTKVIQGVSNDLEIACALVLKEGVQGAEQWIEKQSTSVKLQIQATSNAETNTRNALNDAGSFSTSEIEAQINVIRAKGKKLEETLNNYEILKKKAQSVYQASEMEEQ